MLISAATTPYFGCYRPGRTKACEELCALTWPDYNCKCAPRVHCVCVSCEACVAC